MSSTTSETRRKNSGCRSRSDKRKGIFITPIPVATVPFDVSQIPASRYISPSSGSEKMGDFKKILMPSGRQGSRGKFQEYLEIG